MPTFARFPANRSVGAGAALIVGLVLFAFLAPSSTVTPQARASDGLVLTPVAPLPALPAPSKPDPNALNLNNKERSMHGAPLPDGGIATREGGDIVQAWFSMPTDRYGHGVLGDRIEAGALTIRRADGTLSSFVLTKDSVFEDLTPRLADLDGDGRTEVIVVRSYLERGATVAIFGLRMHELDLLTELDPIGQPNRWLNPSLLVDPDGSGRPLIGFVRTPHIGGQLQLWRFDKGQLDLVAKANGFSNHSIGSRSLGLSAVLDAGDGQRIVLPDAKQTHLLVLDATTLTELASTPLPSRPVRDFVILRGTSGKQSVEIGLADGQLYRLEDPTGRLFD